MSVAPLELQGVLPNQLDFAKFQIIRNVYRKDDAHARHFVLTGRARAHSTQHRSEIMTLLAVRPEDHQFTRTEFFDLRRSACLHSTSSTGASKLRMLTCAATFSAIDRSVRALGAFG